MGTFKEIEGDLVEGFSKGEFDIIAHGCNCFATFGAGIALTIGKKYPQAMKADKEQLTPEGINRLGDFTSAFISDKGIIYNLYSQYFPGKDFKLHALKRALKGMRVDIERRTQSKPPNALRIGFPLIGCGIAGGDWEEVREVIKKEFRDYDVTAVHFTDKVIGVNYWPKKYKLNKIKK